MPRLLFLLAALTLAVVGCNDANKSAAVPADAAIQIEANLAKLSPEDRALAERQQFCAHETSERLGSMGMPIKVMVKGEPVFVCCKGCDKAVLKDPDATLETVKRLKEQAAKKG